MEEKCCFLKFYLKFKCKEFTCASTSFKTRIIQQPLMHVQVCQHLQYICDYHVNPPKVFWLFGLKNKILQSRKNIIFPFLEDDNFFSTKAKMLTGNYVIIQKREIILFYHSYVYDFIFSVYNLMQLT